MNALWTSAELAAATLGRAHAPFAANGVSINSRSLAPGDLYIAIKGEHHDGHDFTKDAFAAGAAGALVSHLPPGVSAGAPLLMVANAQRGLEDVGRAARARTHAEVLAVTGSVGKTTAKEMLHLAFGALGRTHASTGSLNNHWGVPLTLAALPRDAEVAVIEIGMNHFGEIRALNAMVRPHVVLITAVAPAHIEFFGSLEAIADAKTEIFENLIPGGSALLPADSPLTDRLKARAKLAGVANVMTFGFAAGDAHPTAYAETASGARVKADIGGEAVEFVLNAPGRHNALAATAALLCVKVQGGDVRNAAAALQGFSALKGRGEKIAIGGTTVIDESYNANPASMAAALTLLTSAEGRKIAVLGDMLEMGGAADEMHAGLADVVAKNCDLAFLCGPHMQALWQVLPQRVRGAWAEDSAKLAPTVADAAAAGDTFLIKGSHGSKMAKIIDALKARMG
jgi:UDP-N-acetylmuramoyl-tripeptide--D-alanyl-D-alanine ligase